MADMTVIAEADAEIGALDLHHEWKLNHDCGFSSDLDLHNHEVANMASRLRGISAIAQVLLVESPGVMTMGDNMRAGLLDAIDALAVDANEYLERANIRAAQAAAKNTARSWKSSLDQLKAWAATPEGGSIAYASNQPMLDRLGASADAISAEHPDMEPEQVWRRAHEHVLVSVREQAAAA